MQWSAFSTRILISRIVPVAAIVPGSWQGQPGSEVTNCLVKWIVERHNAGTTLCSVCGGAFVLAETGLLAGRFATTHWTFSEMLAQRFPDIHVDGSRITRQDGNFITAGACLLGPILALNLSIGTLGQPSCWRQRGLCWSTRPAASNGYYSNFSPKLHHGDAAVLKVQHWLQNTQ